MTLRPRVGVLGGTFDPIHMGHLAMAHASQRALDFNTIQFVPAARPPHRADSPQASGYHRLEMIRRALADVASQAAAWTASDRELHREGQSYSFDTLAALHREGLHPLQMFFIIGADAFAEIATWHRYPDVLDAAHFVVVTRPGTPLTSLHECLPSLRSRMIVPADFVEGEGPSIIMLDAATPDVSSTDIRRRVTRGESLSGLVPPSVAAYISEKSLYRTEPVAPVAPLAPVAPGSGN